MKTLPVLTTAIALACLSVLAPAQEASPSPKLPSETEVTLIPEQVPEKKKAEKAEKEEKKEKSKTDENHEEIEDRIHYREAFIKAQRDPKVVGEWERAEKAKTDLEKREALKSYYTLLHAKIVALDPSTKKTSDLRRTTAIRRLQQTRIDPTEPLDPRERVERFDRPND